MPIHWHTHPYDEVVVRRKKLIITSRVVWVAKRLYSEQHRRAEHIIRATTVGINIRNDRGTTGYKHPRTIGIPTKMPKN